MFVKWKECQDNSEVSGAPTADLSKAFDCIIWHNLLIAKLSAYCFDIRHLHRRKLGTKESNARRFYSDVKRVAPQGCILGPLLSTL